MKKIGFVLFLFILVGCGKKDEITDQTNELVGRYKLFSLISDKALDLNLDGMETTDFKSELTSFFDDYHYPPLVVNDNYLLSISIPKSSFRPEYNDFDIIYLDRGDDAQVTYYKAQKKVVFTRGNTEEYQLLYGSPIIIGIEVLKDMKVKVTVKHKFYHHPDGWHDVILTGIYEKQN